MMTDEPYWKPVQRIEHPSGTAAIKSEGSSASHVIVEEAPTGPYGWIQWKGTTVCMDIHCACGNLAHFDGDFGYYFRMRCCGRVYSVGQNVMLYELDAPPDELVTLKEVGE